MRMRAFTSPSPWLSPTVLSPERSKRVVCVRTEKMQIKDLPFGVIFQLCRQLDSSHAGRFSWRALLSHVPNSPYNAIDVGAFQRVGHQPNGSPTEAVLQDFIARGFSVDDLYLMMNDMGYVEGMRVLQQYASPEYRHYLAQLLGEIEAPPPGPAHNDSLPPKVVGGEAGKSYVVDPLHGPLPPPNPSPRERYIVEVVQPSSGGEGEKVGGGGGGEKGVIDGRGAAVVQNGHNKFPWQHPHPPRPNSLQNGVGTPEISTAPRPQYHVSHGAYPNFMPSQQPYHHQFQTTPPGPSHQTMPPLPAHPNYLPTHSQPPSYHRQNPHTPVSGVSPSTSEYPVFSPAPSSSAHPQYSYSPLTPFSQNSTGSSSSQLTPSSPADSTSTGMTSSSSAHSDTPLPNILHFSFQELSEATSGFTAGLLGMGSFGSVYKAMVRGTGPYAVKKLHNETECEGGMFYEMIHRDSFLQELLMLTKYHHRNILSLVAFSNDGYRPCLVYEYMENGSLGDCLHGRRNVRLPWGVRLSIADQVADALHFLHTVNHPHCLVHGDIKSANILLDSHLVPRLSDFGLARECSARSSSSSQSQFSTQSEVIMGTVAYMAPEFFRNRKLSPKTDVYSFGVVLLELYTGLAADDPAVPQRALTMRLAALFKESAQQSEIAARADPHAGWPSNVGCGLFDIATVCVRRKDRERPTMDQVKTQVSSLAVEMSLDQLHISSPPPAPPPYSYP